MANRHVQAKGSKSGDESEFHYLSQETDSPIMPVSQIVELQKIRPDIVDFIVKETELEADFRRKKVGKINGYIALERVLGVLCALVLGLAGIVGGGYVAIKGHDWVGVTISTTTIGTLAVAFLKRKSPV